MVSLPEGLKMKFSIVLEKITHFAERPNLFFFLTLKWELGHMVMDVENKSINNSYYLTEISKKDFLKKFFESECLIVSFSEVIKRGKLINSL